MSAETINSKVESAVTAIESGDWSTAISKLMAAKALLSATPDQRHGGNSELRWDRNAINELISECKQQQASASGVGASSGALQFQKIRFVRDTSDSE